jgi:hypothetical protein
VKKASFIFELVYTTEILGYTQFVVPRNHKQRGQDLAQPPTIAWRGKQMNVEETLGFGSGSPAYSVPRTPDATGQRRRQEIPGARSPEFPHYANFCIIASNKKSAPRGAFSLGGCA